MTFSFTPGYSKCLVLLKRISVGAIGRKQCSGDELSLSLSILVKVCAVASSRLSLNVGRVEVGIPIIRQHHFWIPSNSSERPLGSPPHTGLAYLRTGHIKVKYTCTKTSQGRHAFLAAQR